jgi:hypothetical protein
MVYTDGSIMSEKRGVGMYCETKGFEGRYSWKILTNNTLQWSYFMIILID